jgi:hypothetical protein
MRASHENEIKSKDALIRDKEKEIQSAKSEIDRISRERDAAVTQLAVKFHIHFLFER